MARFLKKIIKTILGLILLPICWAAARATVKLLASINPLQETDIAIFFAGAVLFSLIFIFWKKPMRMYVWGHEMTHVIAIILCRGKIKKISTGKNSGYVKSDKINFLISLAPYYFPFYATLLCVLFKLASILFPVVNNYTWAYVFGLGLAFAFHFLFTFYVVRNGQDDIKYNGWIFSAVTIAVINIVLFGIFVSVPATETGPIAFLTTFTAFAAQDFLAIFYWLLQKLGSL